jgi:cytochrome c peroxidase
MRKMKRISMAVLLLALSMGMGRASATELAATEPEGVFEAVSSDPLDRELAQLLRRAGFTGRIQSTLEKRLGRPVDTDLAGLGRLLFFDSFLALHGDNSCAGCHAPQNGFGDTQSIAIGVGNNGVVGKSRTGPRNQRRSPMLINTAFLPKLMLNGRFAAVSGDPFDNSEGFRFPAPEGREAFGPGDRRIPHLLTAQGHIPPTELPEMAGFTGTRGTLDPLFDALDEGQGASVPSPDDSGSRNAPIREAVLARLNASSAYRERFGALYPRVARGGEITFPMVGQALAEFQISLTFADAPIDRFARGQRSAMSPEAKRGAVLFFGRAGCVSCHTVAGSSNEMFSDFEGHVVGVPQIAPAFGAGKGNVLFDGPERNEDFGLEQVTGDPLDRYKFRTSPLRNVALQPAFFHNGAFTRLEDAVRHHLDALRSARAYSPEAAGLAPDLRQTGPVEPVLKRLSPRLATPLRLGEEEIADLVAFLRDGLLDARARPDSLCRLVPASLPSGEALPRFEGCPRE